MVKLPPAAFVVSKPNLEPLVMPLVEPEHVARLVSRVVMSPVLNSPLPPTLKASVVLFWTLIFAAVQLSVSLL